MAGSRSRRPHRVFHMSRAEANRGLCPSYKRSYTTEYGAEIAAKAVEKKGLGEKHSYFCPLCKHYHLTSD